MLQLKDITDIQRVDIKPFCLEIQANNKVRDIQPGVRPVTPR